MARLTLSLLGPLRVAVGDTPVTRFDSGKVRALLAYLAVETDRPHSRETLAGLLWPDQPERTARHSLSQALSNLRHAIGDQGADAPFLLVSRDSVQFNPASDHWVDATAFTALLADRHRHRGGEICAQCVGDIEQAVALYRGSFLEGFSLDDSPEFEEWALRKREQLARLALNALYALADHYEQSGAYDQARRFAWRQVELDPLHEPAHRQLMRSYAWAGRRAAALRQYHECARILEEELGVPPSEETTALYEEIKERRMAAPPAPPSQPAPPAPEELRVELAEVERPIFVARDGALSRLDRFLDAALAGRGQVAFVVGEAGSGKTALFQEFARRASAAHEGLVVVGGNCNAHTGLGDPYLPFREALAGLTGDVESQRVSGGGLTLRQARRLWDMLPAAVQALVEVGPDLIDTFVPGAALAARAASHAQRARDLWAGGASGALARLETLVASGGARGLEQTRLFEQYAEVLKTLAASRPLLVLLDDLQWADAGSLSLLFHLGRKVEGSRIMIAGAFRSEDVALGRGGERHPLQPVVNELTRALGDIGVDLDQIAAEEGRRFVDAILDCEPNRLGADFRDALYQQTGGHPLFTVELLRDLQARGDLARDAEGRWVEGPALGWETLPARVEGAIAERVGRLDEALREALTIASVEGETFTAEVVAQVQAADQRDIVRRLSGELGKQHRLVSVQGVRRTGPRRMSVYRFRHSLFQKYLYTRLDAVERAYLHEDVGHMLEMLYGDEADEIAVQLARHFQEAGQIAKAIEYLRRAADRAIRLSAYAEAIALLARGLDLLKTLPDTDERAALELGLQVALGVPLSITRGFATPEVAQTFARARALCQQMGATPELFPVLWGLFSFYLVRAEDRPMREISEQLLDMARQVEDPALQPVAHWAMGVTLLYTGDLPPARAHLEQMMSFYEPGQRRTTSVLYAADPGVSCRFWTSWALWLLGYPDQALERSYEALALAQQLAHPASLAYTLFAGAALHQFRREPAAAQGRAEAAIALATEHGFPFFLGLGTLFRGWALAEQGQTDAGIAEMRQGLQAIQATGARIGQPHVLALLAEAHGSAGQAREGLTLLAEALTAAKDSGERHYEAELHRLRGELLLKLSAANRAEAESCFQRAIAVARQQRARSLELRATLILGRLWQHDGRRAEAAQMLARIYGWFTEGFETADLRAARALLDELG